MWDYSILRVGCRYHYRGFYEEHWESQMGRRPKASDSPARAFSKQTGAKEHEKVIGSGGGSKKWGGTFSGAPHHITFSILGIYVGPCGGPLLMEN